MKHLSNLQIAIVGCGPGGLTLARLLQQQGAAVHVYERDLNRAVRVQGATLDLHEESGLKALAVAGLMEAFKTHYRPGADKLRIMDKTGRILLDEHVNHREEMFRPEIDRGPLRELLLDALQPGTVIWNSRFVSLTPDNKGWELHFENGATAKADLVIAADGANSKLRPYLTPIRPFFAGMTAIEGAVYKAATTAPEICNLVAGGKIFAMDDSKTLIVSAKGDGTLAFYAGINTNDDWVIDFTNRAQVLNWFDHEFAGWDPVLRTLFEQSELPLLPRPQYCMPLDQTWEAQPNLTMLGDAAHLMPPYAGEGVNMAMLDALELSECLANENLPDIQSAIAAYETAMRTRASATAADTLEWTKILHSPQAAEQFISLMNAI